MNATWSFIDLTTGELTGGTALGGLSVGFAQPDHILPVLGVWPPAAWRYDLVERRLVARDASAEPLIDLVGLRQLAGERLEMMTQLERTSLRSIRECLLALHRGEPMPATAVERLTGLEALLSEQRPGVQQALQDLDT